MLAGQVSTSTRVCMYQVSEPQSSILVAARAEVVQALRLRDLHVTSEQVLSTSTSTIRALFPECQGTQRA